MDYQARRQYLQEKLRRSKIDVLLVSGPENRRYLSGYTARDHGVGESSGALLIAARGTTHLLTDSRYELQARQETDLPVAVYRHGLHKLLERLLPEIGGNKLAFESHHTLHADSLRLSELAEKLQLSLTPVSGLIEKQREIKSEDEIELIRRSVQLNEAVFQQVFRSLATGMSEIDIALAIETAMRRAGADGPSFETIVASGENSARPHAVPTSRRVQLQEPITIDMGLVLAGYCSDMTRSFTLSTFDERFRVVHRLVRTAQQAGIAAIRPGATMKAVDRAARSVIEAAGYGRYFGHSLGHGVGLAVHEAPSLSARSRRQLKEGMIVTVEPGVYLPGWGGIRLENMIVVRRDGAEILNEDQTWLDL
ncbi:M24 family metallopeptidase [Desulfofustis glycolicus]|uniref:Xaa-Pro aminopeptidase n=1 Tax=Desulfofustis glycolicus DSM 9705 TaxID=1121409 RepID=A0A1M5VHX2_9BACT|nr:Xaa-Pro peptidase family protein [Desulfofustis glycolicus]MCB2217598.1 Xaa-Pro peptidase family protein [Desulfobulbaceae bacterium]SHH74821.1 Xaa-Pro aminopeptidase [Desulfofustis glycolicus DSM 9705]